MIIERDFSKYVSFLEDSIVSALEKINTNQARILFVVSESGIVQGSFTDGDFRRWIVQQEQIDLSSAVSGLVNPKFHSASIDDDPKEVAGLLSDRITHIPLLDANGRIKAVASNKAQKITIAGREISDESAIFVIAEIGNNHNGSLQLAKELIDKAAEAGVDCAKFQMRDMTELYKSGSDKEDAAADLGTQYTLDILNKFQLEDEALFEAFDYSREKGMVPLCTPWDIKSLEKLEKYGMEAYKVASADFTNWEFLAQLAKTGKPLICSTGMSTESEIVQGIEYLNRLGAQYILLHCNSTYPAPFKDVNLAYLSHLKKIGGAIVGYSGHERDVYISIAASAMGAKVIEKHFTLDKSMEGNDHKVSLLPDELTEMVEGIRQVEAAIGVASERALTQGELMNRENLAKSIVALGDIREGETIARDKLTIKSPGQGLQPYRMEELIGLKARRAIKEGDYFFQSDIDGPKIKARDFLFQGRWGVPVRYHDLAKMKNMTNLNLLEIHLSYKDMELDFEQFIEEPLDLDLVVHSPELFAGDHTLDLCSANSDYRQRSITEMQRVIDLTRKLKPWFSKTSRPVIVTNVGGFTSHAHMKELDRQQYYERLRDSLKQLDVEGVEIAPQTMPPFPWHFGGQQFHNLFMDAESIVRFCEEMDMRICLDVSHSKLACNYFSWSLSEFVEKLAPYTAHLHLADASGVDGEGLQVGDGDIDWGQLCSQMNRLMPQASFIPEIWQGHKNDGEGCWIALDRLEQYLAE